MPSNKWRTIALFIAFSQVSFSVLCDAAKFRGFSYEDRGDSIAIVGYDGSQSGEVYVPGEINGKPVRTLAFGAFPGITISAERILISENVTTIEEGAFLGVDMEELVLPSTLSTIESGAFQRCDQLRDIVVRSDNPSFQSIDGALFTKDGTELVLFPAGQSFGNEGYILPDGVVILRDHSFSYTNARTVNLPDGLRVIGSQAFFNSRIENISIPSSVDDIDPLAFWNCFLLETIEVNASNAQYSSVDGVLFENQETILRAYPKRKPDASYTIPSSVAQISALAINRPSDLMELTIPASVEIIEENGITLDGSAIIVDEANPNFASQDGVLFSSDLSELISYPIKSTLFDYQVPGSVTHIAPYAFALAGDLIKVTFPEGMTTIGERAFDSCRNLSEVVLPSTLLHIEESAFRSCRNLGIIALPEGLQSLGDGAFLSCRSLFEIVIPEGITALGESIFRSCNGLVSVTLPNTLTIIGEEAFGGCRELAAINLPDGLEQIGVGAFSGCRSLSEVVLPESVFEIGAEAFQSCQGLTLISIPPLVKRIEKNTFFNCLALEEFTVPSTVEFIAEPVFGGSSGLQSIFVEAASSHFMSVDGILLSKQGERLLKYPVARTDVSYTVPSSVKVIDDSAFFQSKLELVTLPTALSRIGGGAFASSSSLRSINLTDRIIWIGPGAFQSCWGLASIYIPRDLPYISNTTFYDCRSLKAVAIPSHVEWIGDAAFKQCYSLEEVSFVEGLKIIGSEAFLDCFPIKSLQLPTGLEQIQRAAFRGCGSLDSLDVPDGVVSIGDYAFFECREIKRISFPSSLESIGAYAFDTCQALSVIDFAEGLKVIGYRGFRFCEALNQVAFPESLETIGSLAFAFCYNLRSIYFFGDAPVSHTDFIDDNVFAEVDGQATVYFLSSASGFTTPEWAGIQSVNIGEPSEAQFWLIDNGYQHETLLDIDPFQTGSPILLNYALKQAPGTVDPPSIELSGDQVISTFFGDRSDLTYLVEVSKDLVNWSSDRVTISEPDLEGMRTASLNADDGRCFVRFRFVQE